MHTASRAALTPYCYEIVTADTGEFSPTGCSPQDEVGFSEGSGGFEERAAEYTRRHLAEILMRCCPLLWLMPHISGFMVLLLWC